MANVASSSSSTTGVCSIACTCPRLRVRGAACSLCPSGALPLWHTLAMCPFFWHFLQVAFRNLHAIVGGTAGSTATVTRFLRRLAGHCLPSFGLLCSLSFLRALVTSSHSFRQPPALAPDLRPLQTSSWPRKGDAFVCCCYTVRTPGGLAMRRSVIRQLAVCCELP